MRALSERHAGRVGSIALIALIALALLASAGCRRRGAVAVIANAQMERYQAHLIELASRDTGCHPAQLVPQQISVSPVVYTVAGCAVPVEYWLHCGRACRWEPIPPLSQMASLPLSCPPEMISTEPGPAPHLRFAGGCGRGAPFGVTCNAAACGWTAAGPIQVAATQPSPAPVASASVSVTPRATMSDPAVSSGHADPAAGLRSQVQAQREAILSCLDGGSLVLHLRWTAGGQVVADLPRELLGTAAEGCIQAAIGGLRVQAHAAGELVIPLR